MTEFYEDIAKRTGGDIYIGVVGPVRTGKSTFIKNFMETAVLPNITDENLKARTRDELPQSASGRAVMTAEPKFIPENGIEMTLDDGAKMRVRLVDCVGYLISGADGAQDDSAPRMVSTPWSDEKMEFSKAAKLGTDKVMHDHATVGVVVTTDGSIGDFSRPDYTDAEKQIVEEMKKSGKPFILLLNCTDPASAEARALGQQLEDAYGIPVAVVNCGELSSADIEGIFSMLLSAFPLEAVEVDLPEWIGALPDDHPQKESLYASLLDAARAATNLDTVPDAFAAGLSAKGDAYLDACSTDPARGVATVKVGVPREKYFEILSSLSDMDIRSDAELFSTFCDLAKTKRAYDRVAEALEDVEKKGYGIVMPTAEELTFKEPQVVKEAGGYGVRLRAGAKSIHMIKAEIEAEVNPMIGSEAQSAELVESIRETLATAPETIWDTNMFGRTLYDLVSEGLRQKLTHLPDDAQKRLSEALERIINEGSGGLICIIL